MIPALWLAALPCLFWTAGVEGSATLKAAGLERVCVPAAQASAWRDAGLAVVPVTDADRAGREALPVPGMRPRGADRVSATRSPWIFASGWKVQREPGRKFIYRVPAGKAALAAAEAYAYGADALIEVEPADLEPLGRMLAFLSRVPPQALPDVADVAVVDDGSSALGEVLNLLARRNLLFRIVKRETPELPVNVKLGTALYPTIEAMADPSAIALKVRRQLGDERRHLRLFGSEVVIGRLTAAGERLRLHLLNYAGREIEGLRVRVRGTYPEGVAHVAETGRTAVAERMVVDGATEFTLPRLGLYAVVDLPPVD